MGNQCIELNYMQSKNLLSKIRNNELVSDSTLIGGFYPRSLNLLENGVTLSTITATNQIVEIAKDIDTRLDTLESKLAKDYDKSKIKVENVPVQGTNESGYRIFLSGVPKGDIISIVVHLPSEDLMVDGIYNIYSVGNLKAVDIRLLDIQNSNCTVTYLI